MSDERRELAAEYVLGTLDEHERAEFETALAEIHKIARLRLEAMEEPT